MRHTKTFPVAALTTVAALALVSCGANDPLLAHLKTFESNIAGEPADATAILRDIYGPEWAEFATVCPYSPQHAVDDALGTEDSPIPDNGLSEDENYPYLASDDRNEKWIRFARSEMDLCNPTNSSSQSLTLEPISATLDFTLIQPDSIWTLTDFGN